MAARGDIYICGDTLCKALIPGPASQDANITSQDANITHQDANITRQDANNTLMRCPRSHELRNKAWKVLQMGTYEHPYVVKNDEELHVNEVHLDEMDDVFFVALCTNQSGRGP